MSRYKAPAALRRFGGRQGKTTTRVLPLGLRGGTVLTLLLLAAGVRAETRFVSPLPEAQLLGPQAIEITTDATAIDRVEFHVDGALAGVARQAPYRIAFDFGMDPRQRVISATVWAGGYRRSEQASLTSGALTANETVNVDLVEVPVRIRSNREVTPADLRVRENGIDQKITAVRRERPPAHFAFVVDRSLSMSDGKLEAALEAVAASMKHLREGDSASLVLFNHRVEAPLSIDDTDLKALTGTVLPSGGTSLRDALASTVSDRRTYAIAITDGGDRNSQSSEDEVLRAVSGTRTIVNAIVLGTSHAELLDRATRNTGGAVSRATPATLRQTLDALLNDLNARHLVIYQSSAAERGWRKVEVKSRGRGIGVSSGRKEYHAK